MLKTKNWLLSLFVPGSSWVTISPNIYHPAGLVPGLYPAVLAHEETHLAQQAATGRNLWLWRYLTSKAFRLDQEAKAIAVEVLATPAAYRPELLDFYSNALSGRLYLYCAGSPALAQSAIEREIGALEGVQA